MARPMAKTAVELAVERPYDLILMDLRMPMMDGIEATRRIRQLPNNAQVPVLALTGNVIAEVHDRAGRSA
jgi:two-component system sensor histidine kinase/response regulator